MTDFRERYKRAGFGREDLGVSRALRSQRRNEARRERRDEHLSSLRADFISDSVEFFSQKQDSSFSLDSKDDNKASLAQTEYDSNDSENSKKNEEGLFCYFDLL